MTKQQIKQLKEELKKGTILDIKKEIQTLIADVLDPMMKAMALHKMTDEEGYACNCDEEDHEEDNEEGDDDYMGFEDGQTVYVLDYDGDIDKKTLELYCINYRGAISTGNAFHTEEEAKKEKAKRQAIVRIKDYIRENDLEFEPDWEEEEGEKCTIYYDYDSEFFRSEDNFSYKNYSPIGYFRSGDDAKEILENCKKDLEIIFDIK